MATAESLAHEPHHADGTPSPRSSTSPSKVATSVAAGFVRSTTRTNTSLWTSTSTTTDPTATSGTRAPPPEDIDTSELADRVIKSIEEEP